MVFERYSLIGLAFGLILIIIDVMLLRRRKIPGKTFAIWLVAGVSVCAVSLVPEIFSIITVFFGAEYQISAVVAIGFSFFLLLFFYLNYKISELNSQMMKLAMQISVATYTKKRDNETKQTLGLSRDAESERP